MEATTPACYKANDCCVDCGKGVSPTQAQGARQLTYLSRALGDSRNRKGFVLCGRCLDRETREVQVRDKKTRRCSEALL